MNISILVTLAAAVTALVTGAAVARRDAPVPPMPLASIRELMVGLIEPSAASVFTAAAFEVTADGAVERGPASVEEWEAVERNAAILAESANLLLIGGRQARFQRLIALDAEGWDGYARALREGAIWARDAARVRSTPRLLATGGDISFACERCHLAFRYGRGRHTVVPER